MEAESLEQAKARLADQSVTAVMMARAQAICETARLMQGYIENNQRVEVLYALGQLEVLVESKTPDDLTGYDINEVVAISLMNMAPTVYARPIRQMTGLSEDSPDEDYPPPPAELIQIFRIAQERILESGAAAGAARKKIEPDWMPQVRLTSE